MVEWNRKNYSYGSEELSEKNFDKVTYLSFKILEDTDIVKHGFSTRIGGVSKGFLSSMNLSFNRGDNRESVLENYKRIAAALGTSIENMVFSDQTHTTNIRVVTKEDRGKGICRPLDYKNIDGLITNEKDIMLVTFYADCVPIYLVDTKNRAIALCHSGWRGTVGKISQSAIHLMNTQYGTDPSDIVAAIGPSICQDCYEVSEDVILEFEKSYGRDSTSEFAYKKDNGKYQLDLWRANEAALLEAGVLKDNIRTTDICTCCNSKYLFSHRATNGKRGNLAAFLGLK